MRTSRPAEKDFPTDTQRTPSGLNPRRLAANRANMAKARAARLQMPWTYARSRFSAVKHGLFVRTLDETAELLAEDPLDLEAHRRLLELAFLPRTPSEQRIVRRIADAIWRRLRVYRAQARWELDSLKAELGGMLSGEFLDVDETRNRAQRIMKLLLKTEPLYRCCTFLLGEVERQLRALLRLRSGGNPQFKILTKEVRREFYSDPPERLEDCKHLARTAPAVKKMLKHIARP